MICDTTQTRLTALRDGELPPEAAAETRQHLTDCPACAQAWSDLATLSALTDAWTEDGRDITDRVLAAVASDNQTLLLAEMRLLRDEMQHLHAEVAALRRQLGRRADPPSWTPLAPLDYPRMENDPWNLTRS